MTDGDALLREILAAPDDDTPRLVYADWLQENGQGARAAFIRVQCKLAATAQSQWQDVDCGREEELLRDDASIGWFDVPGLQTVQRGFPERIVLWATDDCERITGIVYRGFISSITCMAADWLTHADELYWHPQRPLCPLCPPSAHPIREVELTGDLSPPLRAAFQRETSSSEKRWWHPSWPSIAFRLPGAQNPVALRLDYLIGRALSPNEIHAPIGSVNSEPFHGHIPRTLLLDRVDVGPLEETSSYNRLSYIFERVPEFVPLPGADFAALIPPPGSGAVPAADR